MATPVLQINHTIIPAGAPYYMGTGGTYIAKPPAVIRQNGLGMDVTAGYSSVEIAWSFLLASDMNFWQTILLGQASFQFGHAVLYDWIGTLQTYQNIIVHRPIFGHVLGDTFYDVHIILDQLY